MKSLQLQNLRTKALVCKARFLSLEVETDGHVVVGTKGWFSHIRARRVSKIRQPVASQWEPLPERPTEARKEAGKANHQKIFRRGNDHR